MTFAMQDHAHNPVIHVLMLEPDDKILTMDEKIFSMVDPGDVDKYMQWKIMVAIDMCLY
jgi:hypothetical protein